MSAPRRVDRSGEPLLSVRDLEVHFKLDAGGVVRAVDGVSVFGGVGFGFSIFLSRPAPVSGWRSSTLAPSGTGNVYSASTTRSSVLWKTCVTSVTATPLFRQSLDEFKGVESIGIRRVEGDGDNFT